MIKNFGIYVHIPFCEHKCKYCKFVSCVCDKNSHTLYFNNLKKQIENTENSQKITSIYFGGGTPSVVDANLICETLNLLKQKYNVAQNVEISIECNSNSVNLEKLTLYKNSGFNRISFGAQSFQDETLKKLGRVHNTTQILEAIQLARQVGFTNINIDLILGVNEVKTAEFTKNIEKIKNLGVTHISMYMLMLEKGTVLYNEVKNNKTKILDGDKSAIQYEKFRKILKKYGYARYEISNFALKNYECKHNLNYWFGGEYFGFGTSAHSYFLNKRFAVKSDINLFLNKNFDINSIYTSPKTITPKQKIEEYIMLGLRTKYGINIDYLKQDLHYDLLKIKALNIEYLQKNNAIILKKSKLKISAKFFGVCNQIILKLI